MSTIIAANISDGTTSVASTYVVNGSAKAWVNFNGIGTVAIRDSMNATSLTDSGAGVYAVNFTSAMGNTNYCPTTGFTPDTLGNADNRWATIITGVATGLINVDCSIIANGWIRIDKSHMFVAIHGDLA